MERPAASNGGARPNPYLPPGGRMLTGPLLTERAFARRAGLSRRAVRQDRCIPRIDCPIGIGPAYPAFMLDEVGLRLDAAFVCLLLRRRLSDLEACDWLGRRSAALSGLSPLDWMATGGSIDDVLDAFPPPTREMRPSSRTAEIDDMRRQWLHYRGEEPSPGWTIAWDRVARREAAPHGV